MEVEEITMNFTRTDLNNLIPSDKTKRQTIAGTPVMIERRKDGMFSKTSIADPCFKKHYETIKSVISAYNKAVNDQIDLYDSTMEEAEKNIASIKSKHLKMLPTMTGHEILMREVKGQF